jgi:hypothetical protein
MLPQEGSTIPAIRIHLRKVAAVEDTVFTLFYLSRTMPRILSRNTTMYRRQVGVLNLGSKSAPSEASLTVNDSLSTLTQWMFPRGERQTPQSSSASSTASSPSWSSRRHREIAAVETSEKESRNTNVKHLTRLSRYSESSVPAIVDHNDTWGQFVDTAEAEDELIRHSKVLSMRRTAS